MLQPKYPTVQVFAIYAFPNESFVAPPLVIYETAAVLQLHLIFLVEKLSIKHTRIRRQLESNLYSQKY